MLNDIVEYVDGGKACWARVKGVIKGNILLTELDGKNDFITKIDCIRPVTLLAGMMEKNGLRKKGDNRWYFENEMRLDLGILSIGIDDGCGEGLSLMPDGDITYFCQTVHRLQHILREAGRKDIADNFKIKM